nr:WYL domain-containing protein [Leucobacter exalbidus]
MVLALVVSSKGATKRDLLRSVFGYADRYEVGGENAALDRQFERDKEQLRALGIQVETRDSPLEPGNNQLTRYRISKDLLQFPADLRFDEQELTLLRLAAIAWSDGSMSEDSRHAVLKLEALGSGLDVRHLGVAPKLGPVEAGATQLQRAIDAGRIVGFEYTNPDRDAPLPRRIAPLALHRAQGRWHLIGWDLERDAGRVFLLARITSAVRIERTPFDETLRNRAPAVIAELTKLADHQRAVLRVRSGSVAEARFTPYAHRAAAAAGVDRDVEVPYLDAHVLAAQLVEYGPDVAVVSPAALSDLVVAALRDIHALHAPQHPDDAEDVR